MANIKSAKKRINTINRQKAENKFIKSTLSTYIKKFKTLLNAGEIEKAEVQLKETISYIDSACTKGAGECCANDSVCKGTCNGTCAGDCENASCPKKACDNACEK